MLALVMCLTGCQNRDQSRQEYSMGERVPIGPLTYTVIDTSWRAQLGDGFQVRKPQQRFLLITLSVTNSGTSDVSIPLLHLEGPEGKDYRESENGQGVDNW